MTCDSIASQADLNACAASTTEWAFFMLLLTIALLYLSAILVLLFRHA